MEDNKKLIIDKAEDALRICSDKNIPKFVGFLSPGEASIIASSVKGGLFYGGYPTAERIIFGALPDYLEAQLSAFPITPVEIRYNPKYSLSHRDILGTLMSAGVERSTVGDIIVSDGYAVIFVLDEIADYFIEQISKIKNIGVSLARIDNIGSLELINNPKTEGITFTVSSLRLDAVVSALTGMGRSKSEQFIEDGLVFVNSFEVKKITKKVNKDDVITVRRFGKFRITQTGNVSKKGREIVSAEKYI